MRAVSPCVAVLLWFSLTTRPCVAAEWTVRPIDAGVRIDCDGQLVAEYLTSSGGKPVLWPLIGPTGKPMTRAFPMRQDTDEERDKEHHRSFWFTHGSVNQVDFWSELPGHGTIEHQKFGELTGGRSAVVVTQNDWLGPDGKKQCADERRLEFRRQLDGQRVIDFSIKLKAEPAAVVFGDMRDGTFGIRVASSTRVEAGRGGRIVTSAGDVDADAFGKLARWCDYHGPIDDRTVGIAILIHPAFRPLQYWFVRPYGMFAVNPFGQHGFTEQGDGSYTLPAGESLTLRYRVVLHEGDEKQAKIAEAYEAYAQEP
jgi:hypothetical protein